jgi:hypothetical protein
MADPLSAVVVAEGVAPLLTWESRLRPTKEKPLRVLPPCPGCTRSCCNRDYFFHEEYVRWGYYTLLLKYSNEFRQPSGNFCWECDSLAEREPESKGELEVKLRDDIYKREWDDKLTEQRVRIGQAIARGEDRLPKQVRRKAVVDHQSESRVIIAGTWLQDTIYKARFPKKDERKHKSKMVLNPETLHMCKAWFIPDNESGIWRGEHGYGNYTKDRISIDDDGDQVDKFLQKFQQKHGKVSGKTLSELEAEDHANAEECSEKGSSRGGRDLNPVRAIDAFDEEDERTDAENTTGTKRRRKTEKNADDGEIATRGSRGEEAECRMTLQDRLARRFGTRQPSKIRRTELVTEAAESKAPATPGRSEAAEASPGTPVPCTPRSNRCTTPSTMCSSRSPASLVGGIEDRDLLLLLPILGDEPAPGMILVQSWLQSMRSLPDVEQAAGLPNDAKPRNVDSDTWSKCQTVLGVGVNLLQDMLLQRQAVGIKIAKATTPSFSPA